MQLDLIRPDATATRPHQAASGPTPSAPVPTIRPELYGWALVTVLAAVDIVGFPLSGLGIAGRSLMLQIGTVGLMQGIAWFYRRLRRDAVIATACENLALLYAFVGAAQALDCVLVAHGGSFADVRLARLDAALGLDWPQAFAFMTAHPAIARVLGLAYGSEFYQVIALPLLCLALRNTRLPRELTQTFLPAALASVLISGCVPALGAYVHYRVPGAETLNYVLQINGLRDGTLTRIDLLQLEGLITFPSFHTALALLFIYVARGLPWALRLPLWILNGLILLSVPVLGGHYFVDMLGGGLVAAGAIAVSRWFSARVGPRPALQPGPVLSTLA